jgi:hypothetical protein
MQADALNELNIASELAPPPDRRATLIRCAAAAVRASAPLIADLPEDREAAAAAPEELRGATCGYVAELKAKGAPPERVVVLVKSAATEGAQRATMADVHDVQSIVDHVVRWAIEAYFPEP